jgi:hypothetical protein
MIGNLNRKAITMKVMLWIYAVVGSMYWFVSLDPGFGGALIARYAVGPLWLLMNIAPFLLAALLLWPALQRFIK